VHSLILTLALAVPAPALPADAPVSAPATDATPAAAPAPAADPNAFAQRFAVGTCPADAAGRSFPLVPNTLLELEMVDSVSSKLNRIGDTFSMKVREPLKYGAVELLPVGTLVQGEVVHVDKKGTGGRGGELILAARYAQLPEGRLKLKATLGGGSTSGKNNAGAAAATYALVGIVGFLVQGQDKVMPSGTPLSAKLAENVSFECAAAAPVAAAPTAP
jgi:hypothetical protein